MRGEMRQLQQDTEQTKEMAAKVVVIVEGTGQKLETIKNLREPARPMVKIPSSLKLLQTPMREVCRYKTRPARGARWEVKEETPSS